MGLSRIVCETAISVENRKNFPPLAFCVLAEGIGYRRWGSKN